jgi:hypothetical protein
MGTMKKECGLQTDFSGLVYADHLAGHGIESMVDTGAAPAIGCRFVRGERHL